MSTVPVARSPFPGAFLATEGLRRPALLDSRPTTAGSGSSSSPSPHSSLAAWSLLPRGASLSAPRSRPLVECRHGCPPGVLRGTWRTCGSRGATSKSPWSLLSKCLVITASPFISLRIAKAATPAIPSLRASAPCGRRCRWLFLADSSEATRALTVVLHLSLWRSSL